MSIMIPKIIDGVQCPNCNGESHVIDSRDGEDARRRRRQCNECKFRYSTYEIHAKDYERMRALQVDVKQLDSAISTLQEIKAYLSNSNGYHKD